MQDKSKIFILLVLYCYSDYSQIKLYMSTWKVQLSEDKDSNLPSHFISDLEEILPSFFSETKLFYAYLLWCWRQTPESRRC
jgi:hypothetical protein